MIKTLAFLLIFIHGLIHLLGFVKAFEFAGIDQLTKFISKPQGLLWLLAALMFLLTGILFALNYECWWLVSVPTFILSQVLIFVNWNDAKFGTIANILMLFVSVGAFGIWNMHRLYKMDVETGIIRTSKIPEQILQTSDLDSLPEPVRKYIIQSGALGKAIPNNFQIGFTGRMRDKGKDWFPFYSEQYNFTDLPTRLFVMKAKMFGITVPGYHKYSNGEASMQIKLFGLFPIIDQKSEELFKTETVTYFNDLCLLAPGALTDKRITWQAIDSLSAKAIFNNNGTAISAKLIFNKNAELVDFVSDDRSAMVGKELQRHRFSTPVFNYKPINGIIIGTKGNAIWHYPDGEFKYGEFNLNQLNYNVSAFLK